MSNTHWIAWAAGIIEGEGSFKLSKAKDRPNTYGVAITVKMTDEDVVRKLHSVLGVGTVTGPYLRHSKNKPMWNWSVQNREGVFNTLIEILPYLGDRRRAKAQELFHHIEDRLL